MSIVAWDGKELAADCMAINSGMKTRVKKIRAHPEKRFIAAITGTIEHFEPLIQWYAGGALHHQYPHFQSTENWSRLIVWQADAGWSRLVVFETTPFPQVVDQPIMAWGSGRDFAMGAMCQGASARRAVIIANELSDSCGFWVESYTVDLADGGKS